MNIKEKNDIIKSIEEITSESEYYPELLKNTYYPPKKIYVLGNKELLKSNDNIAIVGSRKCTEYGKKSTQYFAYNLAKQGQTIVSGLAKGIDSIAHISALASKGKTIAVLGNGLDIIYPKENEELFIEIIKRKGLIISEYPLGSKPEKYHFPERNRIISGISKAVLIVEAQAKSGSIITADFALEQGKNVYVVPGNINSPNSVGTNSLIKEGAIPATNIKDIEIFKKIY